VSYQLDEHVLSARGLSQAANIEKSVQQFDCGGEIQRIGSVGGFVVANIPSNVFRSRSLPSENIATTGSCTKANSAQTPPALDFCTGRRKRVDPARKYDWAGRHAFSCYLLTHLE
jgi:hypothetical protein